MDLSGSLFVEGKSHLAAEKLGKEAADKHPPRFHTYTPCLGNLSLKPVLSSLAVVGAEKMAGTRVKSPPQFSLAL